MPEYRSRFLKFVNHRTKTINSIYAITGRMIRKFGTLAVRGIHDGAAYHFKRWRTVPMNPTFLVYQVTGNCNSRCQMCGIWKQQPERELSTADIRKMLESDLFSKLRWVNLTGGEPFLRPDFVDIIRSLSSHPTLEGIAIPTNGLLSERIVRLVRESLKVLPSDKFLSVTVSIDGFRRTHDEIRGVPGAYTKAMKTLSGLSALQRRHPNLNVGVQPTIMKRNIDEIEEFYRFIKTKSRNVGFAVMMQSEGYYANADQGLAFTKEDKGTIVDFLRTLIDKDPQYAYYYSALIDFFQTGRRHFVCLAGFATCFVDPQGNMSPCPILSADKAYRFGNVKAGRSIWFNERSIDIRKHLKIEKRCEQCIMMCDFVNVAKVEFYDVASFMLQHPKIIYRLGKKARDISPYL
jgi:Fe-coproporphyrin III synthase